MTPFDDDFADVDAADDDARPHVPDSTGAVAGQMPTAPAAASSNDRLQRFDAERAHAWLKEMESRHRDAPRRIPVPWPKLSALLAGEMPGTKGFRPERAGLPPGTHVLVGNTGSGKSQFALSILLAALKEDVPSLFIALELGTDDVFARLVALDAGTSWSDLAMGRRMLTSRETASAANLAAKPLFIREESPGQYSAEHLSDAVVRMRSAYPDGPLLVVVDFLQLVGGTEGAEAKQRMGEVAYKARELSREHHIAVMLLSSTARTNYSVLNGELDKSKGQPVPLGEGDPDRLVGLGKESGEIEYASDSVIVLAKKKREANDKGPSLMHVAVAKLRHAPRDWARLMFDGHRFRELTTDEEAKHQSPAEDGRSEKDPGSTVNRPRNGQPPAIDPSEIIG